MLSRSSNKPVPGGGNRGPSPPEAFDGGGGDARGDGDGLHNFHQQLQRYRLGLLFTIGLIVMLFISLTASFTARTGAGRFDPLTGAINSDWFPVSLPVKILLINTGVLLLSCVLVDVARRAARQETILVPLGTIPGVRAIRQTSLMWARATLLAGLGFLFGQCRAWQYLYVNGAFLNSGSASRFFFLLTGTHALHLAAGLAALYACVAPGPRLSLEQRCITLDVIARYWHFIAVMWVYVLLMVKWMD